MLQIFEWLEAIYASAMQSSFGIAINLSVWLFAVLEAAHLVTLAVVGCAVLVVDLRLLGWGLRRQPVATVAGEMRPWLVWGLTGMLCTGFPMFMSLAASKYYSHPAFWLKMGFLLMALVVTFSVRQWILMGDESRASGPLAKVVAVASVLLWSSVGIMGRAGLGYY